MSSKAISLEYKVFGKVQGVFFRKCTAEKAKKLGLVGWVQNDPDGTVIGALQGSPDILEKMKHWLCKTGSPKSVIDKCEFTNERHLSQLEFQDFEVRK